MIHYIEYDPATGEGREIDPFKSPDLVAVVRCRDCKFKDEPWNCAAPYFVEPDGFCAWGKPREEGGGE